MQGVEANEGDSCMHHLTSRANIADPVDHERLLDDVIDRHPRVQRSERVLEDELHLPLNRFKSSLSRESTSMSRPRSLKWIDPESGDTALSSSLLKVVLPHPLSPTSPRHSPRSILRLIPSTATTCGPDLPLPNHPL